MHLAFFFRLTLALPIYVVTSDPFLIDYFHGARIVPPPIRSLAWPPPEAPIIPQTSKSLSLPELHAALIAANDDGGESDIVIIKETCGLGYRRLWPATITEVAKQASQIMPKWSWVMLHWYHTNSNTTLSIYNKWWSQVLKRFDEFPSYIRWRIHSDWGHWSANAVPLLKAEGHPSASLAIMFRRSAIKESILRLEYIKKSLTNKTSIVLQPLYKYLPHHGMVACPQLFAEREIGSLGIGSEFVMQWLLETREIASERSPGSLPLPTKYYFMRRKNHVRFRNVGEEIKMWQEYEARRYKNPRESPSLKMQPDQTPVDDFPILDYYSAKDYNKGETGFVEPTTDI